jgi:hypothetical protein
MMDTTAKTRGGGECTNRRLPPVAARDGPDRRPPKRPRIPLLSWRSERRRAANARPVNGLDQALGDLAALRADATEPPCASTPGLGPSVHGRDRWKAAR